MPVRRLQMSTTRNPAVETKRSSRAFAPAILTRGGSLCALVALTMAISDLGFPQMRPTPRAAGQSSRPAQRTSPMPGSEGRQFSQPQYSAPAVIFRNGYLSLRARNNSLADVLDAVARATGASLQLPAAASNERVAPSLGPAPVAQVMA